MNNNEKNMAVFDNIAETYKAGLKKNIKISGFSPNYFHNYKVKDLFLYLKKKKIEKVPMKILDFGCGVGCSDKYLTHYLPKSEIYACDISGESIKCAQRENAKLKNINYATYQEGKIPFDEKFDIIFVANVFHHIPREKQQKTISLLKSSLKKDGFLIIFEHNPYNPLTVLLSLFTDFRYDKNTNLLMPIYMKKILKRAGFTNLECTYRIFFPGFLKALTPYERFLKKIPFGAHYYYIAN